MSVLIAIALKSLLIAGVTLLLLAVLKHRSAAERSWVAHIGLFALVVLAFAPVVLPRWNVESALFARSEQVADVAASSVLSAQSPPDEAAAASAMPSLPATSAPTLKRTIPAAPTASTLDTAKALAALYAVPAVLLLFITLVALGRLIALRARADVLVDGHWLSALARAQRRMGFKHGTALLTSSELASPISWGLMRPVILLNTRAVEASGEAEAIIAHELAHVARMDWVKLLLARIATALFWFNPLVWVLAREAHQLREEAADDAVLAADIADTDYAQLLVGVARHECPGLLLGAHGVAPSRSSLARRVARVLDVKSVRGPAARGFAAGILAGALLVTAPLAALTFTPKGAAKGVATTRGGAPAGSLTPIGMQQLAGVDLPSIIADGVNTSVEAAVAAVDPDAFNDNGDYEVVSPNGATVKSVGGTLVSTSPSGASVTVYPADAKGRRKVVAKSASGAIAVSYADEDDELPGFAATHLSRGDRSIDKAIALKAVGATPEYISAMRAISPSLRDADADEFVQLRAVGVTPDYVRELASAGFVNLDADELTQARALSINASFAKELRAAGFGDADLDDLVEAKAVGVNGAFIRQMRLAGYDGDLDDFVAMRAVSGVRPVPPTPPTPPTPRTPR